MSDSWIVAKLKAANKRQWAVVGLFIVNIIATYVGNVAVPGKNNGDISRLYPTLLTPPGGAFSIWGFIFCAEAVFNVWQLFNGPAPAAADGAENNNSTKSNNNELQKEINKNSSSENKSDSNNNKSASLLATEIWANDDCNFYAFALYSLMQSAWAIVFPQERMWVCFVLIFLTWLGLMIINVQNMKGFQARWASLSAKEGVVYYLFAALGQSVHLGWITAATGLNLQIAVGNESSTYGPQLAAATLAIALVAVNAWERVAKAGDFGVAGALIWALAWISKRSTGPVRIAVIAGTNVTTTVVPATVHDGLTDASIALATIIGVLAAGGIVWRFAETRMQQQQEQQQQESSNNKKFDTPAAPEQIL